MANTDDFDLDPGITTKRGLTVGHGTLTHSGAPVDGATYKGLAAPGTFLVDLAASPPVTYINVGSVGHPVWTVFAGGTSLSGVTGDGQTPGGLVLDGVLNNTALSAGPDSLASPEIDTDALFTAGPIQAARFSSIAYLHDGHIGDNDGLLPHATFDGGGYAAGCILQRVPAGHTMTNCSVVGLNATLNPDVPSVDALLQQTFLNFLPDDGSGAPDFSSPWLRPFGAPIGGKILLKNDKRTLYFHLTHPHAIDESYWLMVKTLTNRPYSPFFSLDAALNMGDWPLTQTYTDIDGDGANLVDAGLQHQLYWSFAHDQGFTFQFEDGTVAATLSQTGYALTLMLGENGKTPPAAAAPITGNVTTGDLAALQTVVGQLLTALDAKGSITKSTS